MIKCSSEIGTLKKIIIHSPDNGIEQVTPDKAVEYLYEDIVYLDKMKREHDVLCRLLKAFIGEENVLDVQNLLAQTLAVTEVKELVANIVARFEHTPALESKLVKMNPDNLAYTLITGLPKGGKNALFSPASNYIFCRDIGVVVNKHLLVCQAMKRARSRESLLSWFVYHYHPFFSELKKNEGLVSLSADPEELLENIGGKYNDLSIEGGDVMMFGENNLLIGCSERTTKYAFEKTKDLIFRKNVIDNVTMVEIPKERYCMHLDTIFTRIDKDVCVVFAPLILEEGKLKIKKYIKGKEKPIVYKSLKDLLLEINPNMKFIACGGGKYPYAEREQWTDGCNLFALKPGVAVTYDRNIMTTKAIENEGYKVVKAESLVKKIKSGEVKTGEIEKTLILIPSNELSRARGGTHCLTFPLIRE